MTDSPHEPSCSWLSLSAQTSTQSVFFLLGFRRRGFSPRGEHLDAGFLLPLSAVSIFRTCHVSTLLAPIRRSLVCLCSVDLRKDASADSIPMYAGKGDAATHVVLSGGLTMFQGIGEHVGMETTGAGKVDPHQCERGFEGRVRRTALLHRPQ